MPRLVLTAVGIVFGLAVCHGLTEQECRQFDYLNNCYTIMQNSIASARNMTTSCNAILTYIECVEYVACECKLTTVPGVANQLTYIVGFYSYQQCQQYTGEFVPNRGIPCYDNATGSVTEGELLVLATSVGPLVLDLEAECNGFQACYVTYDTKAALALHERNLVSLCSVLDETIVCLENAACACGESNNTKLIEDVVYNNQVHTQTCSIVKPDILPKKGILCSDNGTAVAQTVCDTKNPIYKCFLELDNTLVSRGNTQDVRCPALKTYIQCTEEVACECGLIRAPSVYRAVTVVAASFNDSNCAAVAGPVNIVSGLACPDGTGTREDEDRLIIALSEDPSVVDLYSTCPGVKPCYNTLDNSTGIALFEKNIKKLCAGQKVFIECMEETYCQCGLYDTQNATDFLTLQRDNHMSACFTDSVLRADFKCAYGSIGFKCTDNTDCQMVVNSECGSNGMCACTAGHIYDAEDDPMTCTKDMRGTIGYSCSNNADCQLIGNSECGIGGVCACQGNFLFTELDSTCKEVSSAMTVKSTTGLLFGLFFLSFCHL
ncbi:uncharacterized protein LOC124123822 [Haliotis rufescens]|uniref:uncharacterized protein LOC124123822 n=1 Tax=Haliotis rufescens TaxID=6454 RepID=UPI001EAF9F63|nr:uncharacterized protein LOC124123822 [Haliotis rufescens]